MPATTTIAQTTTTVEPQKAARDKLDVYLTLDRPKADAVAEHWVPQLSAKKDGIVVDGITYVPTEILRDHQERRDAYGSILVWADSFNFPNLANWYITVVPEPFDTSDGALQWCRSKNIDKDNCFAKLLSHRSDIGLTLAMNK